MVTNATSAPAPCNSPHLPSPNKPAEPSRGRCPRQVTAPARVQSVHRCCSSRFPSSRLGAPWGTPPRLLVVPGRREPPPSEAAPSARTIAGCRPQSPGRPRSLAHRGPPSPLHRPLPRRPRTLRAAPTDTSQLGTMRGVRHAARMEQAPAARRVSAEIHPRRAAQVRAPGAGPVPRGGGEGGQSVPGQKEEPRASGSRAGSHRRPRIPARLPRQRAGRAAGAPAPPLRGWPPPQPPRAGARACSH